MCRVILKRVCGVLAFAGIALGIGPLLICSVYLIVIRLICIWITCHGPGSTSAYGSGI